MKKTCILFACIFALAIFAPAAGAVNFTDVPADAWYAESVEFVVDEGLFAGVSATTFEPDTAATRGMFITVLGRLAGFPTSGAELGLITKSEVNLRAGASTSSAVVDVLDANTIVTLHGLSGGWYAVTYNGQSGYVRSDMLTAGSAIFSDVPADAYYAVYVQWAYFNGLVNGTGTTTFSPDAAITRQEICTILSNYTDFIEANLPTDGGSGTFTDDSAISAWAKSAVYTMQAAVVISGRDTGAFDPTAGALRCELAAIMMRYIRALEEANWEVDPGYEGYINFGNVVGESAAQGDSYFADACFIGHSIPNGLSPQYTGIISNADFYTEDGFTTSSVLTYEGFTYETQGTDENGNTVTVTETGTLAQALEANQYGKVYIMLGINEVRGGTSAFYNNMAEIIELVQRTQGSACKIFLMSITPLSESYTANHTAFARENLIDYNDQLQQLSLDYNVYYLDLFGHFCDENGYALEAYFREGLHLNTTGLQELKNYLLTHTVR